MAGCNDCKFYKSELGDFVDGKFERKQKCGLGNDSQMLKWWADNGYKVRGDDTFDDMDCHDYHDSTKHLIKLNEEADKLLELLRRDTDNNSLK